MKFKIEIEAHKEKIKKEYIIEASNAEEFSRELARIEREMHAFQFVTFSP